MVLKFEMKRGAHGKANMVKMCILKTLPEIGMGGSDKIMREIARRTGKRFSWNTVKKYCDQLAAEHKINMREMPPTAGKTMLKHKLVIYYTAATFSEAARRYAQYLEDFGNTENHNKPAD